MANYLDLTTKSSNLKRRLPKLRGQIPYTRTITNSDVTLFDYDSGETVFLAITGSTDINITLPRPRLGLNFTFINALTPAGSGDALIKSAGGDDTIVVQSTGPQQVMNFHQQRMTFSAACVTSNSIAGTVDGNALSATAFDTSSDQTLEGLASKMQATPNISTAVVSEVASATDNDRIITITGEVAGIDVELSGFVVTGGASQPTIAITTVTEPITTTGASGAYNLLADNVKVEAASLGGEWIEFYADNNFWYSRVTNVTTAAISMNG